MSKKQDKILMYFIAVMLILAPSCNKAYRDLEYSAYKPILMSRSDLLNSVTITEARTVDTVFKVGFCGDNLLVGKTYKGIHVLDISESGNVRNLSFISVPGIIDFVVNDSVIFVNNSVDLVAIKLISPTQIQVLDREEDVLPSFLLQMVVMLILYLSVAIVQLIQRLLDG
jgi:hypothetical protein